MKFCSWKCSKQTAACLKGKWSSGLPIAQIHSFFPCLVHQKMKMSTHLFIAFLWLVSSVSQRSITININELILNYSASVNPMNVYYLYVLVNIDGWCATPRVSDAVFQNLRSWFNLSESIKSTLQLEIVKRFKEKTNQGNFKKLRCIVFQGRNKLWLEAYILQIEIYRFSL